MPVKLTKYFDPTLPVRKSRDDGNLEVLLEILAQLKNICPVNKEIGVGGQLRNSYMVVVNTDAGIISKGFNDSSGDPAKDRLSTSINKGSGAIGSNVEYAPYQEFGTRRMGSQPHLQPSVEIVVKGGDALKIIKRISKENMELFGARK